MHEQSKAAKRRFSDGAFHTRYFVGKGVDIGGKPDPLEQYSGIFPRMASVRTWDLGDGDAQLMAGVADGTFDFVHSSHCLEHMRDVRAALLNWIRIVKPGGFLVVTVPDEDLYEQGQWPSRFNRDHKWSFTIMKPHSALPKSINVLDLLGELAHLVEVERVVLLRDFFREALVGKSDQTLTPVAECAIEFILRKREQAQAARVREPSAQVVYDNLGKIRDQPIAGAAEDLAHGVVVPHATYSPWRADADFGAAYATARRHTPVDRYRAYELWKLVGQTRRLDGAVLAVGARHGGSAVVLGLTMRHFGIDAPLVLADSGAGGEGDHADTVAEAVAALLREGDVTNVQLLKGGFPDTRLRFCYVDVDASQPAGDIFAWVWPRLVPGGIVVFDGYGFLRYEGVTRFVNEIADRPDLVCIHNLNGHAVVVKSAAGGDEGPRP